MSNNENDLSQDIHKIITSKGCLSILGAIVLITIVIPVLFGVYILLHIIIYGKGDELGGNLTTPKSYQAILKFDIQS